jgi:hypothetical protein
MFWNVGQVLVTGIGDKTDITRTEYRQDGDGTFFHKACHYMSKFYGVMAQNIMLTRITTWEAQNLQSVYGTLSWECGF